MEITSNIQYEEKLKKLYWLIVADPPLGTIESDEIESLVEEIEAYEKKILNKEE